MTAVVIDGAQFTIDVALRVQAERFTVFRFTLNGVTYEAATDPVIETVTIDPGSDDE